MDDIVWTACHWLMTDTLGKVVASLLMLAGCFAYARFFFMSRKG